jgi:hypothetical protein
MVQRWPGAKRFLPMDLTIEIRGYERQANALEKMGAIAVVL